MIRDRCFCGGGQTDRRTVTRRVWSGQAKGMPRTIEFSPVRGRRLRTVRSETQRRPKRHGWVRIRREIIAVMVALAFLSHPPTGEPCEDVSAHAYRIVVLEAMDLLPEPLRGSLAPEANRVAELAAGTTDRVGVRASLPPSDHFVFLDVAAKGSTDSERKDAAGMFPRNRESAGLFCSAHGVKDCGVLPWALLKAHDALSKAFRTSDRDQTVQELAALLHLVTDASLPFRTTACLGDGVSNPYPTSGRFRESESAELKSVAARLQELLVDRRHERLRFETRVWPGRFTAPVDPSAAVFDTLLASHDCMSWLLAADQKAIRALPASNRPSDKSTVDQYVKLVEESALPLLKARWEAGALLGAQLIQDAWQRAGSPTVFPLDGKSLSRAEDSSSKTSSAACDKPFCGSRDSTIFHRASCPHARRIKPENLVGFTSIHEASQLGRVPCRRCQPDATNRPDDHRP